MKSILACLLAFVFASAYGPLRSQTKSAPKSQTPAASAKLTPEHSQVYDHIGTLKYINNPSLAGDSDTSTSVSIDDYECSSILDGISNSVSCRKNDARDFYRWEELDFTLDNGDEVLAPSIDCTSKKPLSDSDAYGHPCFATAAAEDNNNALYLLAKAKSGVEKPQPSEDPYSLASVWQWQIHYRLYTTPRDHKQYIAVATDAGEIFYKVYKPEPKKVTKSFKAKE